MKLKRIRYEIVDIVTYGQSNSVFDFSTTLQSTLRTKAK